MTSNVLELIPQSEIETWKAGEHVLVVAGTGKCKTTWVKQVLWPYCKTKGLSLYTLANRVMLRDDIQHGTEMPVITYQLAEHRKEHPVWNADVVVLDECHCLASDIQLDPMRNKMLRLFENGRTIIIGLTATPVKCVSRLFDSKRVYMVPREYPHVESISTYYGADNTKKIMHAEAENGRVLCFMRSAQRGKEIKLHLPSSAFICSKNAPQWDPEVEKLKESITRQRRWGHDQVLITTKVMDNGVSIEDPQVTAVIVETDDYAVDLIQMIGRIRCLEGQRIRLYIRLFPHEHFEQQRVSIQRLLNEADKYLANLEDTRYGRNAIVLGDGTLNGMAVSYLRQRISDIDDILLVGVEEVISAQLCHLPVQRWQGSTANSTDEGAKPLANCAAEDIKDIITGAEGRRFYDRKKLTELFEDFTREVLDKPQCSPYRRNINRAFELSGLPYKIIRKQAGSGFERGKYYFTLVKN